MNETPVSKKIQETWQALVPIIIDLAQIESCAAIMTMIDGADEGMFAFSIVVIVPQSTCFIRIQKCCGYLCAVSYDT